MRDQKNAPRTLDLDVLLYDDIVRWQPDPIVPHPRMHEREFVLAPLAEIAPDVIHPILKLCASTLLARLRRGHSQRLDGLRAMVTGSTKGIGRAIAIAFAEAGADVIIHGRSAAPDLKDAIEQLGRRAAGVRADLSNIDTYHPLIDQAFGIWNGIDIWVNNAGVDVLTGEAAKWQFDKKIATLLDVDVRATITLSRIVGERMRAQAQGGTIINLGWDQADTGQAGDTNQLFAATKGAVMAFTKSLAATLAPTVRVNCIAPGWIKTAWGETASAIWQQRAVEESMLRRWGTPADVAATAVWLASPAAQFITGQTINVNGGLAR